MRYFKLAVLLIPGILLAFDPVFAQRKEREPDNPSSSDTVAYIDKYSPRWDVSLNGTTIEWHGVKYDITADILDLSDGAVPVPDQPDYVWLSCKGKAACLHFSNLHGGPDKDEIIYAFATDNSQIAPHVANAYEHLIRLTRQQADDNSGPF